MCSVAECDEQLFSLARRQVQLSRRVVHHVCCYDTVDFFPEGLNGDYFVYCQQPLLVYLCMCVQAASVSCDLQGALVPAEANASLA